MQKHRGFFIYVSMKVQKESPGLLHFKEKEHINLSSG